MGESYLGIDVGTSALRVSVIGPEGAIIARASAAYETTTGPAGVREQDPEAWTGALTEALARLHLSSPAPSAIGLCGQTPTLVLVGSDGRPVRPAMTWQDTRARSEAEELARQLGDPMPLVGTNLPWSAANIPAKLLWLARHEPESRAHTRWLLQPKDYVAFTLTGRAQSDAWSSKGICRVSDGEPASAILEACGWEPVVCPAITPAWAVAGAVTPMAAARFGLPAGVPVATGWSDALAQVLAAGCYERKSGFFFSGTSAIVGAPVDDPLARAPGLFFVPDTCSPAALLYGPTQSSGAAISWVAGLLEIEPGAVAAIALEANASVPTFVPYLSGERAPFWDGDLRAVFLGVGDEHGRREFARAVLEATFFSARHVLSLVETATASSSSRIEVVGRGVGDPAWEHIAVRSLGTNLAFHDDPDLSARGAAMLAAVAGGADLTRVAGELGAPHRVVAPEGRDVSESQRGFARYLAAAEVSAHWRSIGASSGPRPQQGGTQ